MNDALVYFSPQPLKLLGIETKADGTKVARVAGYLAVFSGPDDPDLAGDFFRADTDFGLLSTKSAGASVEVPSYYQHGFDEALGRKAIGTCTVKADDVGLWAEHQIALRDAYTEKLAELAGQGVLGQSSGAVAHLVEREVVKSDAGAVAAWIKTWPLGEASLTPTPCEPRTTAVPVKALPSLLAADISRLPKGDFSEPSIHAAPPAPPPMEEQNTTPETEQSAGTGVKSTPAPQAGASQADATQIVVTGDLSPAQIKAFAEAGVAVTFAPGAVQALKTVTPGFNGGGQPGEVKAGAPGLNLQHGRGDSEAKALAAFYKTGDLGAVGHLATELSDEERKGLPAGVAGVGVALKADQDMGLSPATSGGHAVPTGHYGQIIEKRRETMIAERLGLLPIPGRGTSVDVPTETGGIAFTETGEAVEFAHSTPTLGMATLTLKKYTARVPISYELLDDEDSNILGFISSKVGQALADKHNDLLITEVGTNGTKFVDLAKEAIAFGDPDKFLGNDTLAYYLESESGLAWAMRPSTHQAIKTIIGQARQYVYQTDGAARELLGAPVHYTNKAGVIGASAKSLYFGNWNAGVAFREGRELVVIRDPYSLAGHGQVRFLYHFRTVYKVVQAEAIGYAQHAAS